MGEQVGHGASECLGHQHYLAGREVNLAASAATERHLGDSELGRKVLPRDPPARHHGADLVGDAVGNHVGGDTHNAIVGPPVAAINSRNATRRE